MSTVSNLSNCAECGAQFESQAVELFGRVITTTRYCQPCVQQHAQKKAAPAKPEPTRWERICPAEFRKPLDMTRVYTPSLTRLNAHRIDLSGLVLHGVTGAGKTRLMWHYVRKLLDEERRDCIVLDSVEFGQLVARHGREGDADEWLLSLAGREVVCIDDVGQMKFTERAEECFWWLVNRRTRDNRPIILTTQFTGDSFAARFISQERGQSVARRLREFCEAIHVKKITL